jgi:segregation and condensation protein B
MSLKAKLEAVIYAAEEPVTLAQLAALFAADALEWKAEQEAASAEQAAGQAAEADQPMTNAEFAYLELGQNPADAPASESSDASLEPGAATVAVPSAEVAAEAGPEAGAESTSEPGPESSPESGLEASLEPSAEAAVDTAPAARQDQAPATEDQPAPSEEIAIDAEAELKRLARLRDREARAIIRQQLDELIATYASDGRGIEIREIAGGFRMATKPECHDAVRLFVKSLKPALRLSLPALETLAVIAYKQPVTAPEVNEIRGVDSSGVFGSLLARKLIATAGRKQVIGRPILYKTTREFLLRFGLKDVSELPSMEEFEKMAASELEEVEQGSDGEIAPQPGEHEGPDSTLEFDENSDENEPVRLTEESDSGAVPESAETPAEQETPVAEMPAPMPAVTAAQNTTETPAATAADPSGATEVPLEVEAPGTDSEPQPRPANLHAANEPASQADSTPAEAAPAAPSPTEQAEIETFSHDR